MELIWVPSVFFYTIKLNISYYVPNSYSFTLYIGITDVSRFLQSGYCYNRHPYFGVVLSFLSKLEIGISCISNENNAGKREINLEKVEHYCLIYKKSILYIFCLLFPAILLHGF